MRHVARLLALSLCSAAQVFSESPMAADFRGEGERFKGSCSGFSFDQMAACGELLFTDHPLHLAAGSLAPGNGFGEGAAMVGHWTTTNWRNTWDVDAVASPNLSWRAGGYMTFVRSKLPAVTPGKGRPRQGGASKLNASQEQPVFHLYAETDSLNTIAFFGLGPSTYDTGRSFFGMRQTVTGGNVVFPVMKHFNIAILGEANGRFIATRGEAGQSSPSIEQLYTPVTAPGLFTERGYAQFGEGIRIRPSFAGDHIQLDYLVNYQQYVAPSASTYSFRRFTTDVSHVFPLYHNHLPSVHQDFNGPDECSASGADSDLKCPPVIPPSGPTRDLEGSFQLRFLLNESIIPSGHVEPFYLQPTLGGSDINGNAMLPSFQDYRFRAPNAMLFRAAFEHSIYKWPVGVALMLDEGKVAQRRSDIDFSHLQHSYTAGLTLHAGGFPMVYLLFSWGGHEGTHTTASMNTSLLGGGARPSLF
jgi:hypothetical protein